MRLGVTEDYTTNIELDDDLKTADVVMNIGVHSLVTLKNILQHLPRLDSSFNPWSNTVDYGVYSKDKKDIVSHNDSLWQSKEVNTDSEPNDNNSDWLKTNIDSLRLKAFLSNVNERAMIDMRLFDKPISNNTFYDKGEFNSVDLSNDFVGYRLEPKGSDYVTIRINEISFQSDRTSPSNIYITNQGALIDTFTVEPTANVSFTKVDKVLSGTGEFVVSVDGGQVFRGSALVDSQRFKGMYIDSVYSYGEGSVNEKKWNTTNRGCGLGFNISVILDSDKFIDNNEAELSYYFRHVFEYMALEMFISNPNNRDGDNRIIMDIQDLKIQLNALDADTVAKRRKDALKEVMCFIKTTYDTGLNNKKIRFNTTSA